MRDIKFRAKGNDEQTKNRWFYGSYYKTNDTTYCCKEDYDRTSDNTHHYILFDEMTDWGLPNRKLRADIDIETLGQYTGIKDRNSKEIYEGDIAKLPAYLPNHTEYAVCKWIDNNGSVEDVIGFGFEDMNGKRVRNDEWEDYEIVGNIFENPELLGDVEE